MVLEVQVSKPNSRWEEVYERTELVASYGFNTYTSQRNYQRRRRKNKGEQISSPNLLLQMYEYDK